MAREVWAGDNPEVEEDVEYMYECEDCGTLHHDRESAENCNCGGSR